MVAPEIAHAPHAEKFLISTRSEEQEGQGVRRRGTGGQTWFAEGQGVKRTGAGSPWGLPPTAPTDPDVHVKMHPVRHVVDIAVPHTTRSFRGDTLVRHGVLGVVPTPRPQRGTPFAPRGPEGPFPRFKTTMGRCDSLPSISPRFVSFAWRYHRFVPLFVPVSLGHGAADQPGVGKPVSRRHVTMETARSPKFPGNPSDHSPCSSDPGVTRHAGGSKCR